MSRRTTASSAGLVTDGIVDLGDLDGGTDTGAGTDSAGADANGGTDAGRTRRPRSDKGKPRGKRGAGASTQGSLGLTHLATLLASLHIGLAVALDAPELALTPDQADALANATADVLACYDVGMSAKNAAWLNLAMTAGGIYGGKLIALSARKRAHRQRQETEYNAVTS